MEFLEMMSMHPLLEAIVICTVALVVSVWLFVWGMSKHHKSTNSLDADLEFHRIHAWNTIVKTLEDPYKIQTYSDDVYHATTKEKIDAIVRGAIASSISIDLPDSEESLSSDELEIYRCEAYNEILEKRGYHELFLRAPAIRNATSIEEIQKLRNNGAFK
jgi:hypothetical protein